MLYFKSKMETWKQGNMNVILMPYYLIFIFLTFLSLQHFFFWDTVQLASRHAHFFFETNFSSIFLPNEIDSGHIPSFGALLAFAWKLFGKSLWVGHLLMLPFLLGIVWQSMLLLRRFIPLTWLPLALAIFLADSALLGQSILVSPDVVLVFFFFLAINSLLNDRKVLYALAIAGLMLISLRGMMIAFSLFLAHFIIASEKKTVFLLIKNSLVYLPGALITIAYLVGHFLEKKWIGYHADSPWQGSFQLVSFNEILRNIVVLIWRFMDNGRVFLWIIIAVVLYLSKDRRGWWEQFKKPVLLALLVFLPLGLCALLYKSLVAHRYFLPVFMLVNLVTLTLLFNAKLRDTIKRILGISLLLLMFSGSWWIYPIGISTGWDAMLGHFPYYSLREDMIHYLETENIKKQDVGSFFPNIVQERYISLTNDTMRFHQANIEYSEYILYSNLYNDDQQANIQASYRLKKEFKRCGIYIQLYQKNKEK